MTAPRPHEAEGDGGGVGAAANGGRCGCCTVDTRWRTWRGWWGGLQRRAAVAGYRAPAGLGGLGPEARAGPPPEVDGAAAPAVAAAARARGAGPRLSVRSVDDQAS